MLVTCGKIFKRYNFKIFWFKKRGLKVSTKKIYLGWLAHVAELNENETWRVIMKKKIEMLSCCSTII